MNRLAFFLVLALAGCNASRPPTADEALPALLAVYDAQQPSVERDSAGNETARYTTTDAMGPSALSSRPVRVTSLLCDPHPSHPRTWACALEIDFGNGSHAWSDWLFLHTPSAGWQSTAQQPEMQK